MLGLTKIHQVLAVCVSDTVVEPNEQGGMVSSLAEHSGSQEPRGGDLPRFLNELEKGWSPEPHPAPPPQM